MVKVIGLTGSIATGKSFVAEIFRNKNIDVFSSDKEVSNLLEEEIVVDQIKLSKHLKACVDKNEKIDKMILSRIVFSEDLKLEELEKILHPMVRKKILEFIDEREKKDFILIEVPLLFENGYKDICYKVLSTYCNKKNQKERALRRKNIDIERLEFILKKQINNVEKAKLSDYVIFTGGSYLFTDYQISSIMKKEGII